MVDWPAGWTSLPSMISRSSIELEVKIVRLIYCPGQEPLSPPTRTVKRIRSGVYYSDLNLRVQTRTRAAPP